MLTDSQRAALAVRLRRGRTGVPGGIGRRAAGLTRLPLSYGQEQLWFIHRLASGQPIYNIPHALRLSGPLDARALGAAVDALVSRHEALRTRLVPGPDDNPVQVVDPPGAGTVRTLDLSGLPPGDRQARLDEFIGAEAVRPFALDKGPLLRVWLIRLAGQEHLLLIVVHHCVFDGWSADVLTRELAALYRQEAAGEPSGLADLPVQYADYALWERDRLRGQVLEDLEGYWRQTMDGFETVRFPADRPRPPIDDFAGGLAERTADLSFLGELRELSRREGTTLFGTLLAGLAALLFRYTAQADLIVGTVTANRSRAELAPLIGYLVNTLPIRVDASGDPTFADLLARVRAATTGAYAHQELPFARLVQTLRVERDPSRGPVFQIALTYADRDTTPLRAAGVDIGVTDLVIDIGAAKFDLAFLAEGRADGLWIGCSYKTALFDDDTMHRLLAHYEVLLRGALADPATRLSELPVLTAGELRRELSGWNDTAVPLPVTCVHQGFEAQAAATPDAVAAQIDDETISYRELNRQAGQIASLLRQAGVGPEVLVGVCMRTGISRLAALLGVWKAGGGYVPLDPDLPADRLSFMIADTATPVIIADPTTAPSLPSSPATVLTLDDPREPKGAVPSGLTSEERQRRGRREDGAFKAPGGERDNTATREEGRQHGEGGEGRWAGPLPSGGSGGSSPRVDTANTAYVIYTSGSTGLPKGVVVEHRQAVNFVYGTIRAWQVSPADTVLQFASLNFDASVMEMFVPLLAGAKLVFAPPEARHSARQLAALIRRARITFTVLPPVLLGLMADELFPDVRILFSGGDELPAELVRCWLRPGLRFVNAYGPTEATVLSVCAELDERTPLPPPIGRPTPNCVAYVLDAGLNPVPAGVPGELHVGGPGLTRGYLNRPALTGERFIPDPFSHGGRLYKTGDIVRRRPDGTIVYLGRADRQVKIRGLRIELGEIEAAMAAFPAVGQAVVTVVADPAGDKQLIGYLRPTAEVDLAGLRARLTATLPAYMIPAQLITVDEFPVNASGKIDRAALPPPGQPQQQPGRPQAGATPPATPTQAMITRLYAAVLGRDEVGTGDSFFDLGGNSLQVMRLVDLISRETGADIAAATVFLHPAPRDLAAAVDAVMGGALASSGPLTALSDGEGDLPLVLIHPVGGTVACYSLLARELAGTFRVCGLQAPGLSQPETVAGSLADLADEYAELIRAAIGEGPWRLGGWSMGGVLAFEVASRLERAGSDGCLLALLDPPFAIPASGQPGDGELAGRFVADAVRSLGWDASAIPAGSGAEDLLAWLAGRLAAGGTEGDAIAAGLRQRFEVFRAHNRMLAGYRPRTPAVRAPALIISARRSPNYRARQLWARALAGPVSTEVVDSDHYAFLRPPLVAGVGASILESHHRTARPPLKGQASG